MVVSSFSGSGLHVQHCTVLESCAAFFGGSPGKTPGKKPQMLEVWRCRGCFCSDTWLQLLTRPIRFQVFFLSLVRPKGGMQDWSALKEEYDKRYGFPAPEMSAALFEMFSALHLPEMPTLKWDEPPKSHRNSIKFSYSSCRLICIWLDLLIPTKVNLLHLHWHVVFCAFSCAMWHSLIGKLV